jgi:hypothetical protein
MCARLLINKGLSNAAEPFKKEFVYETFVWVCFFKKKKEKTCTNSFSRLVVGTNHRKRAQ